MPAARHCIYFYMLDFSFPDFAAAVSSLERFERRLYSGYSPAVARAPPFLASASFYHFAAFAYEVLDDNMRATPCAGRRGVAHGRGDVIVGFAKSFMGLVHIGANAAMALSCADGRLIRRDFQARGCCWCVKAVRDFTGSANHFSQLKSCDDIRAGSGKTVSRR